MSRSAISSEGLGKRYRIGAAIEPPSGPLAAAAQLASAPLRHLLTRMRAPREDELIWALRDVSFEVEEGEVVGIVGPNGSGKSTLLKVLSRITDPSVGHARIRGRVSCLVEVGTGFHMELTGRENVYMSGAIFGMSKREIDRTFDAIVAFSGVERFLDTPVKRYSSGMKVRLGFAVAAHLEPDVLLVDEVLAVGDAAFRARCLRKLGEIASSGRTVVLVSHDLANITGLCQRALWFEQGRIRADGPASQVVRDYVASATSAAGGAVSLEEEAARRPGTGRMRILGLELTDRGGEPVQALTSGQDAEFVVRFRAEELLPEVSIRLTLHDASGANLLTLYNTLNGDPLNDVAPGDRLVCRVPRLPLGPGSYAISVNAYVAGDRADRIDRAMSFEVAPGDYYGTGTLDSAGTFLCDHSWRIESA